MKLILAPRVRGVTNVNTASLDRIDSSHGYVVGNVQWVHKVVNIMKQSMTDAELVAWCAKVATYRKALVDP